MSLLQENLIRDDNKLILLASLSDSLEYVAESIGRLVLLVSCNNKFIVFFFKSLLTENEDMWTSCINENILNQCTTIRNNLEYFG